MMRTHLVLSVAILFFIANFSHAKTTGASTPGIQINDSVIVINTAEGEATTTLTNKAANPVMLHSSLEFVAEDATEKVIVSPSVARIEAGETQMVRFFLKDEFRNSLTKQTMVRAIFQNIPPKGKNNVRLTIRHNIPLIIHPSGLATHNKPWEFLKFSRNAQGNILVKNEGDYVVRLSNSIELQPGKGSAELTQNYILPGRSLVAITDKAFKGQASSVKIQPANLYGYITESYSSELK
ncbi:fimbria/pilus chaperone family protein [Yersinia nurmii]|uniref:Fimbria/pilus chaperone family protein n=1 Tax=Yersinia nurmii TaxID=685706 RepID=A0AAW7K5E2_9GAMM|nr:fimbria/pilus chaperone family protein [Yersinia nurmii]MDN0088585.1 fimbria/pilus chaperone family protein [Yersinia nurmii]CNE77655.1 putative periplasmic chaperone protein [Yersinia nurmii]